MVDLPALVGGFILKVTLIFKVVILDAVSTLEFQARKGKLKERA